MSAALITASNVTNAGIGTVMTVLADGFLESRRNKGNIIKFVNTSGETIGAPHGTARFIVAPDNLTVSDETDGTNVSLDNTSGQYYDVALTTHKSLTFGFTAMANALDGGRGLAPNIEGRQASLFNTIEKDVCSLVSTSTNVYGTGGSDLTEAVYDASRANIVTNQAPAGDDLYAFYSPDTHSFVALQNLAGYRQWAYTGEVSDQVKSTYGKGKYWKGAWHFESQNVFTETYSTQFSHCNFLAHKDAILVAMVDLPMPSAGIGVQQMNFADPESGIKFSVKQYFDQAHNGEVIKLEALYGRALGRSEWLSVMVA